MDAPQQSTPNAAPHAQMPPVQLSPPEQRSGQLSRAQTFHGSSGHVTWPLTKAVAGGVSTRPGEEQLSQMEPAISDEISISSTELDRQRVRWHETPEASESCIIPTTCAMVKCSECGVLGGLWLNEEPRAPGGI